MISICVANYKSLEFLKLLYKSVKKYTKIKYEFIVHDDCSNDNSKEWLENSGIKYSIGKVNEGNSSLNHAVEQAKYEYVFVPNADHFVLPGWDIALLQNINYFKSKGIDKFLIALRNIEPSPFNEEFAFCNCGFTAETFDEQKLLKFYLNEAPKLKFVDTIQYSYPNCLPKKMWQEVGGMDKDYFPGWGLDHQLAYDFYEKSNCRNFKLLAKPMVYHFINGSFRTKTKEENSKNGQDVFLRKTGMTFEEFRIRANIKKPFEQLDDNLLGG
jgi:glycosyltransferase involved in cell wall biosynthesis